jgi:3-phenylpropionate/cinnamic acid dioxygenase small subunit
MTGHATEMADRVAIHTLLMEYGAALDRRDYDAFGKLFGADGRYETLAMTTVGPEAGSMMRERYESGNNVIHVPNFHLFFNELIWFETPDRARSTSACMFMSTPDQTTRKLSVAVAATYDDDLVREEDGSWRFARRTLRAFTNGPAAG